MLLVLLRLLSSPLLLPKDDDLSRAKEEDDRPPHDPKICLNVGDDGLIASTLAEYEFAGKPRDKGKQPESL